MTGVQAWVAAAVVVAAASCTSPDEFEERRGDAWSDSNGPDGLAASDYGSAVLGITTDQLGATVAGLGLGPAGLGVIAYDENGSLTLGGGDLSLPESVRPTLATSPQPLPGAPALVAVGGQGARDVIEFYDVSDGTPRLEATLSGEDCGAPGADLGRFMAFGFTSAGLPGLLDLVTVRGSEMIIVPDIDLRNLPRNGVGCQRCELSGMSIPVSTPLAVDLFDFNPPREGDESMPIDEIFIVADGALTAFDAFQVEEASAQNQPCFGIRTPQISNLTLTGGAADLGTAWAVGNADEFEESEIALWSPSAGAVFVIPNLSSSGPGGVVPPLASAGASADFGSALAFADIDGDDFDELVIGDPSASPEGVNGAGQVVVFEASLTELEYSERARLFDSDLEENQAYGRAVAEVEFVFGEDDSDILAVGARGEVFTVFRALSASSDPR